MAYKFLFLSFMIHCLSASTVQFGGELYKDGQSARNIGMGGYGASFSVGTNPTQLMHINEPSIYFSHKNKFSGLASVSTFSYIHSKLINDKQYPIYLSMVNRSVNDIPDTRSAMNLDGSIIYSKIEDISQKEVGLAVATIYDINHFTMGLSIKPFYIGLAEYKASGVSGDLGVMAQLLDNRIEVGFWIENIFSLNRWNTSTVESYIPIFMAVGQIQLVSLLVGIEAGSQLAGDSPLHYHAGFEFHKHHEIVIIRGGVSHNSSFSVGFGLALKMLQIDYAYIHPLKTLPFASSHVVSIGILLNKFNQIKGKITS